LIFLSHNWFFRNEGTPVIICVDSFHLHQFLSDNSSPL
jgi:hypothetical protein